MFVHFQNFLHKSTDTFIFLNVKFDVRSRSVNLHAHTTMAICTLAIAYITAHVCFVKDRKQSLVQILGTLSCF